VRGLGAPGDAVEPHYTLHALQYTLATIACAALVQYPYQLVLGTTAGSKEEPTDQPTNQQANQLSAWMIDGLIA